MKKILILFVGLILFYGSNSLKAEQSLDVVASQVETKSEIERTYVKRDEAFSRGVVNILTCWLEIPRNMINDNFVVLPGLGIITGCVKGPFYTLGRLGAGGIDIITFGGLGNSLYNQESFPDYVWQANWVGGEKK